MSETTIETLRRTLRLKAKSAGAELNIRTADLLTLLDEIGRLVQSNDRLRRQNKRLRLRPGESGPATEGDDV